MGIDQVDFKKPIQHLRQKFGSTVVEITVHLDMSITANDGTIFDSPTGWREMLENVSLTAGRLDEQALDKVTQDALNDYCARETHPLTKVTEFFQLKYGSPANETLQ